MQKPEEIGVHHVVNKKISTIPLHALTDTESSYHIFEK